MRRRLVIAGCVLGLALAVGLVTPAGAQFVTQYLARTFTSSAPSGVNGFVCKTAGCRIDVGPGANDHLYSDGASIKTDGPISTISTYVSTAASGNNGFACTQNGCRVDLGTGGTDYLYSDGNNVFSAAQFVGASNIVAGGVGGSGSYFGGMFQFYVASALVTCNSAQEGSIRRLTATGGTGTLVRTRLCVCTSDGAASPAFAWVNLISGTVGTNSTCVL